MADNLHKGHRERLKKELLSQDFPNSIPAHKILETLLFYSIPRKDTNPIAHALLNKFGSLNSVFDADPNELLEVKGVTPNTVYLLKLILPITRRVHSETFSARQHFNSIDDFGAYIVKCFSGYNNEVLIVSSFDSGGFFIDNDIIDDGLSDSISVSVKSIVKKLLVKNPTYVILSHNHLSVSAMPSVADIEMTQSLKYMLSQIDINLIDHIIVANNDYISLAQSSDYGQIFK